ncbi:MAG: oligopeptide transporter, OPT family, partial [Deltaproteobacteria bacterium]|nr:oligopeptide transporter, OPT family [Deltaproteobacteria bacterium]
MTIKALVLGSVLGIVFAGSSVYLALKVGMTVSASIPIAVLSITLFRALARATILENNIVQTAGSAGESIAFAVATVPPALLIMGYDMNPWLVMLVAVLGGALGILMMIPLRRGLIVKEHGKLAYPEGTACAEVLMVGEKGGTDAKMVFLGFGVGVAYKLLNAGFRLWSEAPETLLYWTERVRDAAGRVTSKVAGFNGGSVAAEISPELLGVGYIIGPRVAGVTVAGGVLSYLVLIPALKFFGQYIDVNVFPADTLIRDMGVHQIRNNYILYIGAGAVTMGGMISLGRALPSIANALKSGIADLFGGRALAAQGDRTDRDMPMSFVVIGSLVLVLVMWLAPPLHLNFVGAVLMIVFGFIFVTVSSRITGEIGSSSNPISGMTISAVLLTCLIFLALGWTDDWARAAVLSVGAVVCVAASNGGTTSQDLKTGFLVGATPWKQQVAIIVGAVTSAVVVGWILLFLNDAYTTIVPKHFDDVRLRGEPAGWVQLTLDAQGGVERADEVAAGTRGGARNPVLALRRLTEIRGEARPGAYLTTEAGEIRYVMDPGIGGVE